MSSRSSTATGGSPTAELDERTNRLANALLAAGVGEGDRVLWLGVNSFRILELLVAAAKVGAMLCPANWRQSSDELRFVLDDLEPAVVVWEPGPLEEALAPLRAEATARWICHNGTGRGLLRGVGRGSARHRPVPRGRPRTRPVLLLYTAAFDGRPNGALLSQPGADLAQPRARRRYARSEEGFVFLDSGPLFHIGTMMFAMTTLVFGGTNVVLPTFDPELACALIEQERCQGAMLFPAMIDQLVGGQRRPSVRPVQPAIRPGRTRPGTR